MRFIVDENLPPALAAWLSARGHDAAHITDVGLRGAPDRSVASVAMDAGRVIVTKDRDFELRPDVCTLRLTVGNVGNAALLRWLDTRLERALARLRSGETHVAVLD